MKLLTFTLLIFAHLSGPGLADAPEVSECQRLEQRGKRAEAIELWAVRHGVKITIEGRIWR